MSLYDAFTLLGGVGLFLYGMTIMSTGLRNACGDNLRVLLEKATRNKITSVLAGIAVTVFVQSSSATDVMVIGFVTSGMMTLSQAIGVIMGANIGTTVTAQITAFNIGAIAPIMLFIGAIIYLFVKNKTVQHTGSVILGFGMLFVGITFMKSAIAPLAELPAFVSFVSGLSNPIVTVIFGILFTALLQSSSSATVIFQAFAVEGIITYKTAVFLVIGAAIGAVTPNLLAGLTANRDGKRCAVLNLLFNVTRALFVLTLITVFPMILTWIQSLSPDNVARQIANTHTIFAVVSVLVLLPVSNVFVRLSERLIPASAEEAEIRASKKLMYLTQTDKIPAPIAIDLAHREVARMGEIAIRNLALALDCFFTKDDAKRRHVELIEETVDNLSREIVAKLVELRSMDLTPRQLTRLYHMIQVVDDIERISDHAVNIINYEVLIQTSKARLSEEAYDDLRRLGGATLESLKTSLTVFEEEAFDLMDEANALEDEVDRLKDEIIQNHISRMMNNSCDPQGGIIFSDMAVDLERSSDHAINIAEALVDPAATA
ncbi:MAG: Na/Pi cotransporter family protein [Erysipelotrichales bacterium]|nr:Na/Pi cotransporter family protein [Erysipelotrichales bacterium]MBQ1386401.1 Na/Pi cotransporter family protein [Erysipelotrichales bacterium]MBQ2309921.1 Na/Pi cotransporter family protein [Erysipelotrichales bacterium]MBQ4374260.1 Na/Pi cotransporter family protein [Erysipelotrichales bacterium]MBQ5542324.1 Na/Pi cotransporter family protein [Erysipelotrichales bacterium]